VGLAHEGHSRKKRETVYSAHKNREGGSLRRKPQHMPHPDRVHSSREKRRHRPKTTELKEGNSQGGGRPQKQRSTLPTLKLDSYYGSTCLATFLAKFDKCIEYYNWGECDQLCHLWNSLVETAAQICGSGDQTRLFPS